MPSYIDVILATSIILHGGPGNPQTMDLITGQPSMGSGRPAARQGSIETKSARSSRPGTLWSATDRRLAMRQSAQNMRRASALSVAPNSG